MSASIQFIGVVDKVEDDLSTIIVYPDFVAGLSGLERVDCIHILYWLHQRDTPEHRTVLRVVPRRHGATEYTGVFNTRSPSRPNPIGLTTVELVRVIENKLIVRGLDAFEGTPIIDIKPVAHD